MDFFRGMNDLKRDCLSELQATEGKLLTAHKQIEQLLVSEVQKRCPVEEGRLRNSVKGDTTVQNGIVQTVVGTNVPYAVFIEYGTDRIAKGKVKALGTGEGITDALAIKSWPAKDGDRTGKGSAEAQSRVAAALAKRAAAGVADEQMPFFRPAWNAVKPQAEAIVAQALGWKATG